MNFPKPLSCLCRLLNGFLLASAVMVSLPAQAALNSTVDVRLLAPGGITGDNTPINEVAVVDTSVGLISGDASNPISSFWMLPRESITFSGDSILLRLVAGDENGGSPITGYLALGGNPAVYQFSSLPAAGYMITGLTHTVLSGFTGGVSTQLSGGNQLDFSLDTLQFDTTHRDINGYAWGEVRLDLTTQPIPEPTTWALMAGGLLLMGARVRARQAARRGA